MVNNKDINQVEAIAKEHGLKTRWLTSGENGYPRHLRLCITGFDTYDQAQEVAEATSGEVTSIRYRAGWQYAESRGTEYDAFDIEAMMREDIYGIEIYHRGDAAVYLDQQKEWLQDCIDSMESLSDVKDARDKIDNVYDIASMIEGLRADEFLAISDGYHDTQSRYDTIYSHDVWTYEIAVEWDDIDDPDDQDEDSDD